MSKVNDVVAKAARDKQKAIALTEHGKMASVPELLAACKEHDVKPIIGQEFYIVPTTKEKGETFHLTMLALNDKGYRILSELSTMASLPGNFYRNPRIDYEMIRSFKNRKDIVAYSGCMNGEIPQAILDGDMNKAKEILKIYRNLFPNFFFEFMQHGIKTKDRYEKEFTRNENKINKKLWEWHNKYKIPLVITNDSHYTEEEHERAHDILLSIQTGTQIDNPSRFTFKGDGYHFKTQKEMKQVFHKEIWLRSNESLNWIYANSNIKLKEFTDNKWYIPDSGEKNPLQKVRQICLKNLKQRIPDKKEWPKYKKQLEYELSVVDKAGFANEFLIVYDYVNWARDNDILTGSRGSMAGVLISYLMRITDTDPIRFNLSFENALNPARPSLPDFDVDFDDKDKVIEYIKEKYGEENVMKIGTFNRMNPRSCLGSILRAKGYSAQESMKLTKQLPDTFDIVGAKVPSDLKDMLFEVSPDITDLFDSDEEIYELMFEYDKLVRTMGSHAGGVIISDGTQNLRKIIPGIRVREDTELVSQFDKKDVEKIGFIKFDILGIKTLKLIKNTLELIGENIFKGFPDGDDLDDEMVYEAINGDLLSFVFQLDGVSNRAIIKQIGGVHSFEDIVAVTSLSRPGSAKFVPDFIKNRKSKSIRYIVPELAPILDRSNGVILYIEQVMRIVQDIAGFDMIQVDDVRRLIKGKDRKKYKEIEPIFIKGCMDTHGINKKKAKQLWELIESSGGYLFNRAHAVSYCVISYMTAYLKVHYPLEFYTAAMNIANDKQKIKLYQDAMQMQVKFLRPSVRHSEEYCTVEENGIRIGLSLIKGIGIKTAISFVDARNKHGLKKAMQILPKRVIGAAMQKALRESGAYGNKYTDYTRQKARLGFSTMSGLTKKQNRLLGDFVKELSEDRVNVGGRIENIRVIKTKKGDDMAFVSLVWNEHKNDIVFFPNMMYELKELKENDVILVKGTKQRGYNSVVPLDMLQI